MKLYSKTAGRELDVEVMEKDQGGQILTVIKHASLQDIIYNQLEVCKDPECIKVDLLSHNPYPVYRCTIWDKTLNRCAVGIGSGKPETLTAGIASDYADESASNRAFDRAAITYLQFPGRQLSEEEVGIFLPMDLVSAIDLPETADEPICQEPIPAIKQAPITQTTQADNFNNAMNPPVETKTEVVEEVKETASEVASETTAEVSDVDAAGTRLIAFGKYKLNPKTVAEVCDEDLKWVESCLSIKSPSASIKADIDALRAYATAKGMI